MVAATWLRLCVQLSRIVGNWTVGLLKLQDCKISDIQLIVWVINQGSWPQTGRKKTTNLAEIRPNSKIHQWRPIQVKTGLNPYTDCPALLAHLYRIEPSLMLLVTPVFLILSQVEMFAVKKAYLTDRGLNYTLPKHSYCFLCCWSAWSPPLLTELSGARQLHPCRPLCSTLTFYHCNYVYSGPFIFFDSVTVPWHFHSTAERCQHSHQNRSLTGKNETCQIWECNVSESLTVFLYWKKTFALLSL